MGIAERLLFDIIERANIALYRVMLEHDAQFEQFSPLVSIRQRARDITKKCQCDACIRFQQADTILLD